MLIERHANSPLFRDMGGSAPKLEHEDSNSFSESKFFFWLQLMGSLILILLMIRLLWRFYSKRKAMLARQAHEQVVLTTAIVQAPFEIEEQASTAPGAFIPNGQEKKQANQQLCQ